METAAWEPRETHTEFCVSPRTQKQFLTEKDWKGCWFFSVFSFLISVTACLLSTASKKESSALVPDFRDVRWSWPAVSVLYLGLGRAPWWWDYVAEAGCLIMDKKRK